MNQKRAKIIATVGPACDQPFMLRALVEDGVDTFRLNFSHGEHARHAAIIKAIREIEVEIGRPIGILQDLQGPKIRLGRIPGGARQVETGEIVFLHPDTAAGGLPLPHPEIFAATKPGHRLLIDDGRVALEVVSVTGNGIEARVTQGGRVSDRKGVNIPDCVLDLPVLTEKDRRDLSFGLAHGVDWIALSFVQSAMDLKEIREIIEGRAGLVAKIEKPSAVADIEAIVSKADAVMIARGDLGVEIPPEAVPGHQKEIIALCRSWCKPVIVATQMLESMTTTASPTRAEASDVATAIYDGADAVMLSAETAAGQFPREAVSIMCRIIAATEAHALYGDAIRAGQSPARTPADVIADTGSHLASTLGSDCLVAFSKTGATGIRAAARRPSRPLLVLTHSQDVARRLAMVWGTQAVAQSLEGSEQSVAQDTCRRLKLAKTGGQLVILSGLKGQSGSTNNISMALVH